MPTQDLYIKVVIKFKSPEMSLNERRTDFASFVNEAKEKNEFGDFQLIWYRKHILGEGIFFSSLEGMLVKYLLKISAMSVENLSGVSL